MDTRTQARRSEAPNERIANSKSYHSCFLGAIPRKIILPSMQQRFVTEEALNDHRIKCRLDKDHQPQDSTNAPDTDLNSVSSKIAHYTECMCGPFAAGEKPRHY